MKSLRGPNAIRRLPAALLVTLLAVLTLRAWLNVGDEPLTISGRADGLTSITWSASASSEGRLAVRVAYDFDDDESRTMIASVPEGARFVTIDDVPVSMSNGRSDEIEVSSSATVTYELPGAVTRYRDGAVLRLMTVRDESVVTGSGLFACPTCYIDPLNYGNTPVYGALSAAGAGRAQVSFVGLNSVRTESDVDELRFVGIDTGSDDVAMLATLPAEAFPALTARDGTVADAIDRARSEISTTDDELVGPGVPAHGEHWPAWTLSVLLALITLLIGGRAALSRGSRTAARPADATGASGSFDALVTSPPSDLEPALAGAIVGDRVEGGRSVVAATLLELIHRDVVQIHGSDSRGFTLTVPADAAGATPFEQAVIDNLRLDDDPPVTVERWSPNIWGDRGVAATKALRKALTRAALRAHVFRISWGAAVLVPAPLVMGVVAIVGTTGNTVFAWIVTIVAPLLAWSTVAGSALVLTARGRAEQADWIRYAAWLRTEPSNDHLARAGPWSVSTYGPVLAYAAALGAAQHSVQLLSPERDKRF